MNKYYFTVDLWDKDYDNFHAHKVSVTANDVDEAYEKIKAKYGRRAYDITICKESIEAD